MTGQRTCGAASPCSGCKKLPQVGHGGWKGSLYYEAREDGLTMKTVSAHDLPQAVSIHPARAHHMYSQIGYAGSVGRLARQSISKRASKKLVR